MHFVDDEYLLLSRTGRPSRGLNSRIAREHAQRARDVKAARVARLRQPPGPVVVQLPLPRAIYLVPRQRR